MELTKEYFDQQLKNLASKNDLNEVKSDLNQRIDALPKHSDLDKFATKDDLLELATKTDLNAVRNDIAEVKELVERIDQRTDEDHRAVVRDITDLKRRVSRLEDSRVHQ